MQISKSDFLKYKECPSYAWFHKNNKSVLRKVVLDSFIEGLIHQGSEVEEWVYKMFPDGVHVRSFHEKAVETTQDLIKKGVKTIFQATFADHDMYAMIDVLQYNELLDAWDIFEIKSSSSQLDSFKNEHLDDTGFQRILLSKLGYRIANVYLVQLDKTFVKNGPIIPGDLFAIDEITHQLFELEAKHNREIKDAIEFLSREIEPTSCSCRYKARKKQCPAFPYLYPNIPEYSVYDINRIGGSGDLLNVLVDRIELRLEDISDDSRFKNMKRWQLDSYRNGKPVIAQTKIKDFLESLVYPLYFLDYETLPSAIPKYDGTSPHQQVVIQYSVHILDKIDSQLVHKEYLYTGKEDPMKSIGHKLREDIGTVGSIIVWHKKFEMDRTKELAIANPDLSDFLQGMNDRIVDLKEIVSKGYYVHADFHGSASIKKVLPVLCPELSYQDLVVQNGGEAMMIYKDLIFSEKYNGQEEEIKLELLKYCALDTYAMVRIWEEFWKISRGERI